MKDLRALGDLVRAMKTSAAERLMLERDRWPLVPEADFQAVVRALGDISVTEARLALNEWQRTAEQEQRSAN